MAFGSKITHLLKHRWRIIAIILLGCALSFTLVASNRFGWTWTGFNKSLWDWMQLLIIPVALAVVAIWFNRVERRNEQAIASDNQQEAALQAYLDKMSELLLKEGLRQSEIDSEVRNIARARTLTVLRKLDGQRKGSLLQFLYESGLIYKGKSIISLAGAELNGADLSNADLSGSDLSNASLDSANLFHADLRNTNLSGANLYGADLSLADLSGANLSEASLTDAKLIFAHFNGSNLSNAKLGDAMLDETHFDEAILAGAQFSSYIVEKLLTKDQLQQINLTVLVKRKTYRVQFSSDVANTSI